MSPAPKLQGNDAQELSPWQVLESLGESVAVVDRNMRLVWCRDPLLDKYRPGVQTMGQPCYRVLADRDAPCPAEECPVIPVFAIGRAHAVERYAVLPDGKEVWREARAYPVFDGRGRVAFAARISFDITHRKKIESLRQRDLENMERSLEELAGLQTEHLPFQPQGPSLSPRELEVLRLMSQGLAKRQIAEVLGISLNTVKRHVSNIFNKLSVNDRAQAAVWAARNNLV
jgi:DNA-binding CsgD family transcriptional regulator